MLSSEGSFLWVGEKPISRYQGWFFSWGDNKMVKIIESIKAGGSKNIQEMINGTDKIKIISQELEETFYIGKEQVLFYELNNFFPIEIFLISKIFIIHQNGGEIIKLQKNKEQ